MRVFPSGISSLEVVPGNRVEKMEPKSLYGSVAEM